MLDISTFLDTVGLDFELDFNMIGQNSGVMKTVEATFSDTSHDASNTDVSPSPDTSARIPNTAAGDDDFYELKPIPQPWKVSEAQRLQFDGFLEPFRSVLGTDFRLPSRLAMARYITGFIDGYSHHHPLLHFPTFSIIHYGRAPELVLAVMALGAQYRYETTRAAALYRAGRSLVQHRRCIDSDDIDMDKTRALLLLATYASWQRDPAVVRESLEYQGELARQVREAGLVDTEETISRDGDNDWLRWSKTESNRRTKLCVFAFLNLQGLVLGVPPVLLYGEMLGLRLPTSCREWLAEDRKSWLMAREDAVPVVTFRGALVAILAKPESKSETDLESVPVPVTSPFGDFLLIHALLQRLVLRRQLFAGESLQDSASFSLEDVTQFSMALHRWRDAWHKAPETTLDLRNSRDSLSWTATSLLGLAHIRLQYDFAFTTSAETRSLFQSADPEALSRAAWSSPPPPRGPALLHALLHAVHSLNIPVQLGIDYLARCQALSWSIQHAFCFYEAAVFLSKWLWLLADGLPVHPVSPSEHQVIFWVECIVREASDSLDGGTDLGGSNTKSRGGTGPTRTLHHLSVATVRLFARIFDGCNAAWPMVSVVGESLTRYGDLLEAHLSGG